jgi:enamine deaminase RidA (YjgF/YER057c/UK114 family)
MTGAGSSSPLPPPPRAQGDYQPLSVHGGVAYTAGMTPRRDGLLTVTGTVGAEVDLATAAEATAVATANALAAVASAVGGIAGIDRVLAMTVYIAAAPGFTGHSAVADAGTARIRQLVGGPPPARAAVGVASLPGGSPVEVALVVALRVGPVDPGAGQR